MCTFEETNHENCVHKEKTGRSYLQWGVQILLLPEYLSTGKHTKELSKTFVTRAFFGNEVNLSEGEGNAGGHS